MVASTLSPTVLTTLSGVMTGRAISTKVSVTLPRLLSSSSLKSDILVAYHSMVVVLLTAIDSPR